MDLDVLIVRFAVALRTWIRLRSCLLCMLALPFAAAAGPISTVPKWKLHEMTFRSSVTYSNPLKQCVLTLALISPTGRTRAVEGFWDGRDTWRVRFTPDEAGTWRFTTHCSDTLNRGLHLKTGEMLCTAPGAGSRFERHGPLRLARSRRHFEHQDGTPFIWVADVAWDGPGKASQRDWQYYTNVRAHQQFTAVQWALVNGPDLRRQIGFEASGDFLPNVALFRQLDSKIETLNRAGLLSVIAPAWNPDPEMDPGLAENQLNVLMRYLVARWGAHQVAWLTDAASPDRFAAWDQIGARLLNHPWRQPTVLFRDAMAFNTSESLPAWAHAAGIVHEADLTGLTGPVVCVVPLAENSPMAGGSRIQAETIRHTSWKTALHPFVAGISYCADAVSTWEQARNPDHRGDLPLWKKSLFLPGAKQFSVLSSTLASIPYWQLPRPGSELPDPAADPTAPVTADDLNVFYMDQETRVQLPMRALPAAPVITWVNPRTGETRTGVAVVGRVSVSFPPPGPGDWALLIRARRP